MLHFAKDVIGRDPYGKTAGVYFEDEMQLADETTHVQLNDFSFKCNSFSILR